MLLAFVSMTTLLTLALPTATDSTAVMADKTFVKTHNRCEKSNCSCSGYWGYKHPNSTYEGNCQNTDGYGHRCGHSPQTHGLRSY